jgi:hypothetical protein
MCVSTAPFPALVFMARTGKTEKLVITEDTSPFSNKFFNKLYFA